MPAAISDATCSHNLVVAVLIVLTATDGDAVPAFEHKKEIKL